MRFAFISDIHGNEIALHSCLGACERLRVDSIHFLGDAVGYLPDDEAVLGCLDSVGIACQQGNHEAMLLADQPLDRKRDELYRLSSARQRLENTIHWMRMGNWPTRVDRNLDGRRFLLVHGSPSDELFGYVYEDSDLAPFSEVAAEVVVMGNTHRPWVRSASGKLFVNTGSIGLPRDHGALAAFAIFDSSSDHCHIVRVPLDVQEILRRYGQRIAPEVAQCFARKPNRFVGEVAQ